MPFLSFPDGLRPGSGWALLVLLLSLVAPSVGLAGEPYDWPVDEPTYLTSSFAEYRGNHLHNGVDFSTGRRPGRDVHAVDKGRLDRVFFDPDKYGKTVILVHENGRRTWYSHLNRFDQEVRSQVGGPLDPGDDVTLEDGKSFARGDRIGTSGRTGRGPVHLHLALQSPDGSFLNPIGRFSPRLPYDPSPKIKSLNLLPLTGNTWINGQSKSVRVDGALDDTVELWGTLGVDLTLWNEHSGRTVRSMPTSVRVLRDGSVVRELEFNRMSDRVQDTGVHWLFDRQWSNLSPTQFTVHATPTESSRWTGMEFTDRGRTGILQFVAETRNGETHSKTVRYKVVAPPVEVKWDHQQLRPENPDQVESVRDAGSGFRFASLSRGQFARKQYSPPSGTGGEEPNLSLETSRGTNRVRVDLQIENRWEGWPRLMVRGDDFDTELPLYQVEPGHFVGVWAPNASRDGWYRLEATLPSENGSDSATRRVYLQSVRNGSPGSALSRDGRFSIFSSGSGLSNEAFVTIDTREKKPVRTELEYVERPRVIQPRWLQSRDPFEVTVDLSDFDTPRQIGLYQWNPARQKWTVLSHRKGLTSASRKARIFDPGVLALLRDDRPPRIGRTDYHPNAQKIAIDVVERGSGIDPETLEVSLGGEAVSAYWDADQDRIVLPYASAFNGDRSLEVTVSDRGGNSTEWSGAVSAE